jgi:hypothetical protein
LTERQEGLRTCRENCCRFRGWWVRKPEIGSEPPQDFWEASRSNLNVLDSLLEDLVGAGAERHVCTFSDLFDLIVQPAVDGNHDVFVALAGNAELDGFGHGGVG